MAGQTNTKQPEPVTSEIELVERAFWQIALADSDEKFESVLHRLLTPVLLKADSKDHLIERKVREIIKHVVERLKSLTNVELPMEALFQQCQDLNTASPTLVYDVELIKLGFLRLKPKIQAEVLPEILKCLPRVSSLQQACLLRLFVLGLSEIKYEQFVNKRKEWFGLEALDISVQSVLLEFLFDYLLLPYSKITLPPPQGSQTPAPVEGEPSEPPQLIVPPPGLNFNSVARVTGGHQLEPALVEKKKLEILKLLTSELFKEKDIILHLVVVMGDTRQSVVDFAEDKLKLFGASFDWNSKSLMSRLCNLFLGMQQGQAARPQTAPQGKVFSRPPVSLALKLKLVPVLMKSVVAANMFPNSVNIIFECLFGESTNGRLRLRGLELMHHVILKANQSIVVKISPLLLNTLNRLLLPEEEDQKLRELAYVGIGQLSIRCPQVFKKDVNLVVKMFKSLQEESNDVGLAIQECLSMMSQAYMDLEGLSAVTLEALILEEIENEYAKARLAAIHYASTVFPFDHVASRYVCLLACGDEREDVREEGKKGLSPAALKRGTYPNFSKLVSFLSEKGEKRIQRSKGYSTSSGVLPFLPDAFSSMLMFCQTCIHKNAGVSADEEITRTFLSTLSQHVTKLCRTTEGENALKTFLNLIKQALSPAGGGNLHCVALGCLLEIIASSPKSAIQSLIPDKEWIRHFLSSPRSDTHELAAQLMGLLCKSLSQDAVSALMSSFLENCTHPTMEFQHGAILALGYVGRHCLLYDLSKSNGEDSTRTLEEDTEELAAKRLRSTDCIMEALTKLVSFVSVDQPKLLSAAGCIAIGELAKVCPLPIANESDGDMSKLYIVERLLKYLQEVSDVRCKESASASLSMLPVGDITFPYTLKILEGLFKTAKLKHFELHISVGEAISSAACGPLSRAISDTWNTLPERVETRELLEAVTPNIKWTLKTLMGSDYATSGNPSIRQATCIWLVALLKFCGHHPIFKEYLSSLQIVFVNMLSDDDISQDVASRGFGLIYDLSSKEERKQIVSMLTSILTSGKKATIPVDAKVEIFPEGVLGKTPQKEGLTTYRELCSVASDMNQPDLIYKFLALANHHALWNSRKGAAFGFHHIASKAQDELKPYLDTLIPRIYRYQFDPHMGIQVAMKSIWSSVVPDDKRAVEKHIKPIMRDIMKNLCDNLWRNRESSCHALSDVFGTCQAADIVPYLPELWDLCLKVQDDIKETVRLAASVTCIMLSKVTIRVCDPSGPVPAPLVTKAMGELLPILLNKGVPSTADEVRGVSLLTILKITKNAGTLLKPHIPLLVPVLLESVSSLEPQVLNYLSLKLGEDSDTQEKLDNIRISAAKSSPVVEAINFCLPFTDGEVMEELIPHLVTVIKGGVGMATKVNSVMFAVSLSKLAPSALSPHVGKLMAAMLSGLGDRNGGVRKTYADAIGQLVKIAKLSSLQKLNEKLKTRFFEKPDPTSIATIGQVYYSMVMHSSDVLKSVLVDIVPLVFLAMHNRPDSEGGEGGSTDYQTAQKIWSDVWDELVTGTESAMKMYLGEIVSFLCPTLEVSSWSLKSQGAAAIATLADKAGSNLKPPHLSLVMNALKTGLSGRVWEGKESLLKATKKVSISCKAEIEESKDSTQPTIQEMAESVFKECRKRKATYRIIAFDALGTICETYEIDIFKDVHAMLTPIVNPDGKYGESSDDDGDVTDKEKLREERIKSASLKTDLLVASCTLLGQAWPKTTETQANFFDKVLSIVCKLAQKCTWKEQSAIMKTCEVIFKRAQNVCDLRENHLVEFISAIILCINNAKYTSVRMKALDALKAFTVYASHHKKHLLESLFTCELVGALNGLKNPREKEFAADVLSKKPSK